ncbi:MAG: hypothetical protein R2701_12385 [Acidimicrobiales bacterium]|nr:hypothetical protein [Acidimicrobiales bacterium]
MSEVGAWLRRREVDRASAWVGAASVVAAAACTWRLRADGTVVALDDLGAGHRYLLVPLVIVVVFAGALAGSIAASDVADGAAAVSVTSSRSIRRGTLQQIAVGAAGAGAWAAMAATGVSLLAAGAIGLAGAGGWFSWTGAGAVGAMVARGAIVSAGVGALGAACGLARVGLSLPAAISSVGVVVAEGGLVAAGVLPSSAFGSSYAMAVAGTGQAVLVGLPPIAGWWAFWVLSVGAAGVAVAMGAVLPRLRPIPS